MRKGKISEPVLRRTVLKYIDNSREDIVIGPGTGVDGAVMDLKGCYMVTSASAISGKFNDKAYFAINRALNNIAAMKAEPVGVAVSILANEEFEEKDLKQLSMRIQEVSRYFGVSILGGHTEVTGSVNDTVIFVTAIGRREKSVSKEKISDNAAIIVSGHVGTEGTAILAELKEKELLEYYCADLVRQAKRFKEKISVIPVSCALKRQDVYMHDISQGGILSALWDLGIKTGMGMDVDMRSIPIKQETVEICEFFDINPYELLSGGTMLIVTDDEEKTMEALDKRGVESKVIGHLTSGNDRLLKFGETTGYLNRPAADPILSFI